MGREGSAYIQVESLVKKYGSREALSGVNLLIDRPIIYSLLGPNGAGKSTLMNILSGVLEPTSGRVLVVGSRPSDRRIKSRVGLCPQEHALYERLTGWDNIYFYASLYGISRSVARRRAEELAKALEVSEYLDRRVFSYSGGTKRKLSLIVSVLHDPDVLILDEPTTGMDPNARRAVWDFLLELRSRGKVVLLATHSMEEADRLSDRVGIIDRGKIIVEGTPEELKREHGPKSVVTVELVNGASESYLKDLSKVCDLCYVDSSGSLKLHVEDPDEKIPVIVETLYEARARVSSIRVERPTLEDVFVKLTGRRID